MKKINIFKWLSYFCILIGFIFIILGFLDVVDMDTLFFSQFVCFSFALFFITKDIYVKSLNNKGE